MLSFKLYLVDNRFKKITVTDEKNSFGLPTHRFREKAVSIERKTPKEHITGKKVMIIEMIFLFCLPAG